MNRMRRMIVAGVIGGGGVPLLPFSDDFTRSDGDLGNGWEYTAGKWTIASGAVIGTPGLGANITVNGTFDADSGWIKPANWTIGSGVATKTASASTQDLTQGSRLTTGQWYQIDYDLVISAGGFGSGYFPFSTPFHTLTGAYVDTGRAGNASLLISGNAAGAGSVDNIVCKLITLADMFCTRDFESADIDISVPITYPSTAKQIAIVIGLDNRLTPANFLIAYLSNTGGVLRVEKCLNGTYTPLITAPVTYGAGKNLRFRKSGVTVQAFYNDSQVGADQTLTSPADDAIISATRHGMFTSHPAPTFGSFSATNP